MLLCMIRRSMPGVFLLAIAVLSVAPAALAQNPRAEIETLKKQLEELRAGKAKQSGNLKRCSADLMSCSPNRRPQKKPLLTNSNRLYKSCPRPRRRPLPRTGSGITASGGYDLSAHRYLPGRPGRWRGLNRGRRRTAGTAGW